MSRTKAPFLLFYFNSRFDLLACTFFALLFQFKIWFACFWMGNCSFNLAFADLECIISIICSLITKIRSED